MATFPETGQSWAALKPLRSLWNLRNPQAVSSTGAQATRFGQDGASPAQKAGAFSLQRSELELQAAYTQFQVSPAGQGLTARPGTAPLGLGPFKQLVEGVMSAFAEASDGATDDAISEDPAITLEKLVVERLMGGRFQEVTGYSAQQAPVARFTQASAFSLDLQLDYHGVTLWQGGAQQTDLHLEIHLEQVQVRAAAAWNGDSSASLKRINPRSVDSGQYLITFLDPTTLEIFDKQSRLATTIWGDPHVDLSDVEGRANGEFSDLTRSNIRTTLVLLDQTKVVVTAPDSGVIQQVDIYKGDDHIQGLGLVPQAVGDNGAPGSGSAEAALPSGVFLEPDRNVSDRNAQVASSDVVQVGGDGNDWYDSQGRLVWGDSRS